jgi:hypothetical protein
LAGDAGDAASRWTQIVGKVKLELTPFLNEWWNVALSVTPRGLTSGSIPYGNGAFEIAFDFIDHNLSIQTSDGRTRFLPLIPRSVADFYAEFFATLRTLDIDVEINPMPVEIVDPISCELDRIHASYDAEMVHRWWRILLQTDTVLQRYRSSFAGKSSPIMFFWGSFDLTTVRFSGRPASPPEGAPRFLQLAEDQENIACGFWPGNANYAGVTLSEPAFYAYIYPEPPGFREARVHPDAAAYHPKLGQFILPYSSIRDLPDPGAGILTFFESAYEAAATLAGWNRDALELAELP